MRKNQAVTQIAKELEVRHNNRIENARIALGTAGQVTSTAPNFTLQAAELLEDAMTRLAYDFVMENLSSFGQMPPIWEGRGQSLAPTAAPPPFKPTY